jgi:thioredoxin reductase
MHGFLTRDGIDPLEFLDVSRVELAAYGSVRFAHDEVIHLVRDGDVFDVRTAGGALVRGRTALLATGLVDELPDIPGFLELYGKTIFHCPYCDGWEVRDEPLVVLDSEGRGFELSLKLTVWSERLTCLTSGKGGLSQDRRALLRRAGVTVRDEEIRELRPAGDGMWIVFAHGEHMLAKGMFFSNGTRQGASLARALGCAFTDEGGICVDKHESTSVEGLFVAGNMVKDVELAVVAAAQGAKAAMGVNMYLLRQDLGRRGIEWT